MTKLAIRVLPEMLFLIAFSVPVLSQQEVDPSYYAPVHETTAQQQPNSPVVQTASAPKQGTKPTLVSIVYHPNGSHAKVRKAAAASGKKNSTRK